MDVLVPGFDFNASLAKKAVDIVGNDKEGRSFNGVFLVKKVESKYISVISCLNENFVISSECLCTEENPTGLVITVL